MAYGNPKPLKLEGDPHRRVKGPKVAAGYLSLGEGTSWVPNVPFSIPRSFPRPKLSPGRSPAGWGPCSGHPGEVPRKNRSTANGTENRLGTEGEVGWAPIIITIIVVNVLTGVQIHFLKWFPFQPALDFG